jgi:hypothetical protein
MPGEIDFFSLLIPGLLPILIACALIFVVLDLVLARLGLYRHTWHPALFRMALFAALFSGASLILRK